MHQLSKALVDSFITVAELLLSALIVCINYESNAHAALIEGSIYFNFHTLIFETLLKLQYFHLSSTIYHYFNLMQFSQDAFDFCILFSVLSKNYQTFHHKKNLWFTITYVSFYIFV